MGVSGPLGALLVVSGAPGGALVCTWVCNTLCNTPLTPITHVKGVLRVRNTLCNTPLTPITHGKRANLVPPSLAHGASPYIPELGIAGRQVAGKGRGREVRERPVSPRPTRAAQRCGRARSVLDQVEQALMRHAATGPCLEQLHPASDAIQGGGTGATLGVARRARLGGRAFAFDGRLMTASSTGSLPITQCGLYQPRSAAAD